MKYWIHMINILIIGLILQLFLPWWILGIVAMISAFIMNQKPIIIFLFGLLGGFLLWIGAALYFDIENQQILSSQIGRLFGGINSTLLILITGLLGGLLAAVSSYFGAELRKVLAQQN